MHLRRPAATYQRIRPRGVPAYTEQSCSTHADTPRGRCFSCSASTAQLLVCLRHVISVFLSQLAYNSEILSKFAYDKTALGNLKKSFIALVCIIFAAS